MPDRTTRRQFLRTIGAGAAAMAAARTFAADDGGEKPNVIVIFTDDQGYQDVGVFGSPDIRTPHLDRMAAEGRKFTDFYVAASVCTPSRAALLTGCYPQRVGGLGVLFPRDNKGLNPDEVTIAELLKKRGYATACIGKWHLGHKKPFLPTSHGFDMYYGIPYSNDMWLAKDMTFAEGAKLGEGQTPGKLAAGEKKRNAVPLMRDEAVVEYPADQATLTKRYTDEAVKFIRQHKDGPFFIYLPHTMPHVPLFASEQFKGQSKRGLYGDVIEELDWSVGQILKAVRDAGIEKKTFVLFTSDNGPWLSKKDRGGSAKPLRDGKFSVYEGGMREPMIAWWPRRIPAGTVCPEIAATIDLLPTVAAMAGAKPPADRVIDGKDIRPLLFGEPGATTPHEAFCYWRGGSLKAIRSGKWKLHRAGKRRLTRRTKLPDGSTKTTHRWLEIAPRLYDLSADIGETKDLAEQHPDVVARLEALAEKKAKELKANRRPHGKLK